jgi:ATP-dependent Clp protease adaptor protein ClpS
MSGPKTDKPEGVAVAEPKVQKKLQKPRLWRVLFHNDDYTPMEFVVWLLQSVFHRSENEATAIMLLAHRTGIAVAGVYTREIAETKVSESQKYAEESEYPLLVTMEPDDDPGEEDKAD